MTRTLTRGGGLTVGAVAEADIDRDQVRPHPRQSFTTLKSVTWSFRSIECIHMCEKMQVS